MNNVVPFPKRAPKGTAWERNCTDIRDAFGVAVLRFLAWEEETMEIRCGKAESLRLWGFDHDYPKMPSVKFNGADIPISRVFELGLLVDEPVHPMLSVAMAMTLSEREEDPDFRLPPDVTYEAAAMSLLLDIDGVIDEQERPPLPYRPRMPIPAHDGGDNAA